MLRVERDATWVPLHTHIHHWPYLYVTIGFKDRASQRDLHSVLEILCIDKRVADNNVLALGVGSVCYSFLFTCDELAITLKGITWIFDMTFLAEFLHPSNPFLHGLFHLLRRSPRSVNTVIQIHEFAHLGLLFCRWKYPIKDV